MAEHPLRTRRDPAGQAWSRSAEWQAMEREADEAGRVGPAVSGHGFPAELERVDAEPRAQGR
ncbi:MAG TPA: hypothetical protein VGP02_10460 [Mycobacteriales bacterium]|nr:hypothetical protein [Mycobacteriales bacterium]